jgi:hypothetical protein
MRAFRFAVLLVLTVAATVGVVGGATAAPGGPDASRAIGHVYVNDNTAPVNTVAGFDRMPTGR